jgi:hypothetical protein
LADEELSRGGKAAAGLLAKAVAVFVAGFVAARVVSAAQASVPNELRTELAAMHDDILLIKCRLGIEGRCPPPPSVNLSGPGR